MQASTSGAAVSCGIGRGSRTRSFRSCARTWSEVPACRSVQCVAGVACPSAVTGRREQPWPAPPKRGRQIAAVAVARKLAVLLLDQGRRLSVGVQRRSPIKRARYRLNIHNRRAAEVDRPTPVTSRRCSSGDVGRCPGRAKLRAHYRAVERNLERKRCAGASTRQDANQAAWRRFQPTHRSSPRGRPRATTIAACAGYFKS